MNEHSAGHKWGYEGSIGRFGVHGLPALLLVGLAVIILAGPVFHLALFFLKLSLMLLPFFIVGGLLMWGLRAMLFMGGHSGWHHEGRHWRHMKHWHAYHDEGDDTDGIAYL